MARPTDDEFVAPVGYTDLERIGTGSQAVVFRAVKTRLGKPVALKAFRMTGPSVRSAALEREVDALVALDGHPNIVGVHDMQHSGDHLWLEMNLCTGGSVADWITASSGQRRSWIRGGQQSDDRLATVLRYSQQAAEALRYAHQRSLLHRDVKPANLLIDAPGNVRLADFGIAVLESAATAGSVSRVGTRGYLAPELQFRGPTKASDVYALGVTIEAMCRACVADHERPTTDADTALEDSPVLTADVASELHQLTEWMTAEDPGRRPGLDDVIERLTVLRTALKNGNGQSSGTAPRTRAGHPRNVLRIAAVAAAFIVIALLVQLAPAGDPRDKRPPGTAWVTPTASNTSDPPAPRTQFLVSSDGAGKPANGGSGRPSLDRSGRYVAFTSNATNLDPRATNGHYNVYRKDTKTGRVYLASVGADGEAANQDSQYPGICLNGRYLLFASSATNLLTEGAELATGLYRVYVRDTLSDTTYLVSVGVNGGDADGESWAPRFSGDCSTVLFESAATNLVRDDANGEVDVYARRFPSGPTTIVSLGDDGDGLDGASTHADIAADGTWVAFTSWAGHVTQDGNPAGTPEIYLRNLRTRRTESVSSRFGELGSDIRGVSWPSFSPDGRYLIFRSLTDPTDPAQRGRHVFVWDVLAGRSAITLPDGSPAGWSDACIKGTNNGTNFSPQISDATAGQPPLILFTVPRDGGCALVLRDLEGKDIAVDLPHQGREALEPSMNASGQVLAWAVAGEPQLVYSCTVKDCVTDAKVPASSPR